LVPPLPLQVQLLLVPLKPPLPMPLPMPLPLLLPLLPLQLSKPLLQGRL
jgi:hypothetical protein